MQNGESDRTSRTRIAPLVLGVALAAGVVCAQQQNPLLETGPPMSEALRSTIKKVVIKPGLSPAEEEVGGTYKKETYGLEGGMVAGAGGTVMNTQVGGVNVAVPIPILQLPAMLAGGIAGVTQKEIQDFRDALTEDLAQASSQQIVNDKIAADVYNEIRTSPSLEPDVFARETQVPAATDAVVYVSVKELFLHVEKNEAVITATVDATVTRLSDEKDVYRTAVIYQDRDTLSNWTENDNAVWHDYANFARHYVGREIANLVFESAGVAQTLRPVRTGDVKVSKDDPWDASSKKLSPTLAWELDLPGGDDDPAWAGTIDESNIYYDLEIYDLRQPVYSARRIPDPRHTVTAQLESCRDYRWSVRPVYHVNGDDKYGPWMRSGTNGNGNIGVKASEAPAYIYDFASLEIRCGAK
ncbi:MAG: hypothetical protein GTN98_15425 [Woeseiaceae bacterium]|nr:hypothetical protein [Woeseiaceae bacterium]